MSNSILDAPIREIESQIATITDVATLGDLGKQEREGQNRTGVLNRLQARIGQVMMNEGPRQMQADEVEDLLSLDSNRAMSDGGAESAIVEGKVSTRRPKRIPMWFLGTYGYMPRLVPANSRAGCLADGALDYCPDCGRNNCGIGADGRPLGDVNACPSRERVPFSRCPVCSKKFFDPGSGAIHREVEEGEIAITSYSDVSPEVRIRAKLEAHIRAYHPQEGAALGVRPALTDSVQVAPDARIEVS